MKERKIVPPQELEAQKAYARAVKDALGGREMKYCIVTLGCQMNAHDSETIAGMLDEMGMTPTERREYADLVLYNTCCVRENAENKAMGNVIWLKELKAVKPDMIIGGPPCQDFSSAGKRDEDNGRGDLTVAYARIISGIRPQWFVMENVERILKTQKLQEAMLINRQLFCLCSP